MQSTQMSPEMETLKGKLRGMWIAGDFGQIAFVAQEVVDYEHTRLVDALADRLVATEVLLVEREGERSSGGVQVLSHSGLSLKKLNLKFVKLSRTLFCRLPELGYAGSRPSLLDLLADFSN